MNIQILTNGAKLVKRYRKGRCYGCVWAADTTDQQIARDISNGAKFLPWNETTGTVYVSH